MRISLGTGGGCGEFTVQKQIDGNLEPFSSQLRVRLADGPLSVHEARCVELADAQKGTQKLDWREGRHRPGLRLHSQNKVNVAFQPGALPDVLANPIYVAADVLAVSPTEPIGILGRQSESRSDYEFA